MTSALIDQMDEFEDMFGLDRWCHLFHNDHVTDCGIPADRVFRHHSVPYVGARHCPVCGKTVCPACEANGE